MARPEKFRGGPIPFMGFPIGRWPGDEPDVGSCESFPWRRDGPAHAGSAESSAGAADGESRRPLESWRCEGRMEERGPAGACRCLENLGTGFCHRDEGDEAGMRRFEDCWRGLCVWTGGLGETLARARSPESSAGRSGRRWVCHDRNRQSVFSGVQGDVRPHFAGDRFQ